MGERKHGCAPRYQKRPKEYNSWAAMKQRCYYTKNKRYARYGIRGIKVCERWRTSFANFLEDMGPMPGPGYSIERIDVDGDYCPENCKWLLLSEQHKNRCWEVMLTHDGKTMCVADWARHLGIGRATLQCRLKNGWPLEAALTLPKQKHWKHAKASLAALTAPSASPQQK